MAINSGYSVGQPLTGIFPSPIVTNINPTTSKKGEIGQIWINTGTGNAWILAGITAAAGANWVQLVAGGGLIVGNLTVGGNLTVAGTSAFTGDVTTTNDLTVGNDLTVTGTSALTGAVTTTANLTVGTDLVVNGNLGVTGNVQFVDAGLTLGFGVTPVSIVSGNGDPNTVPVIASIGSIFLRADAPNADTSLYVNTDGAHAWTPLHS